MSTASRLLHAARRPPRHAMWVLVALLLLQAAVPLLASLSARSRGVDTAEVCSVYGVRTISLDAGAPTSGDPAQDGSGVHSSGHCVLTPMFTASFGTPTLAAVFLHAPVARRVAYAVGEFSPPDATQAWVAVRKHGPPLSV